MSYNESRIQIHSQGPWADVATPLLIQAAEAALAEEGASNQATLSVVLVEDDEMAVLHGHYRADPTTTDVLTFPFDGEELPEMEGYLGDIVICYDQAKRQAEEEGHDVQAELALLTVHGVLHLLGYEDEGDQEYRTTMWARQRAIMGALGYPEVAPR